MSDNVEPSANYLRLMKILRSVQTIAGCVAIFLIPLLWAAWTPAVLGWTLITIFGAVILFTLISVVLRKPVQNGHMY